MDLNPAPRGLIPEQSKLEDQKPIGQPKLNTLDEKQAPTLVEVAHPGQLKPMGNSPSSQLVPVEPIPVSTPSRINLVDNKEYLPFTAI